MRLAGRVGLQVPQVYRHYCPEPVYLIARFDRELAGGATLRRHMIDTCQLFNKARTFKYRATTLDTLQQVLPHVRTRSLARQILYRWLMFNVMVGNGDNHLKNISFMVPGEGIEIAPCYDLLSTAVYSTRALADSRATWPAVEMALPVPDAPTFGAVTRAAMLEAGRRLGLKEDVASASWRTCGAKSSSRQPACTRQLRLKMPSCPTRPAPVWRRYADSAYDRAPDHCGIGGKTWVAGG